MEVLERHDDVCYEMYRMRKELFFFLCHQLQTVGNLKESRHVSIYEQVMMFLLIVGHDTRNRVVQERFQHSGETVSRHFNRVLRAICRLGKQLIHPPNFDEVPDNIRWDPRFYPFFKV